MTAAEIKGLIDLARERDQKMYAWIKQLLLLASGALTALVSLRTGENATGLSLLFLKGTWAALGLGILLGAFALHGEVWVAAALAKKVNRDRKERALSGGDLAAPSVVMLPERYSIARKLFYVALVTAVVSLVAFALVR